MRFLAALVLPAVIALFAPHAAAAPANDNRAGATILTNANTSRLRGNNFRATREASDDVLQRSNVWYRWTAPVTATTVFDVFAFYDSTLTLYAAGPGNTVTFLVYDDDGGDGLNSRITYAVTAGTTYYLAVDGFVGRQGSFLLQIAQTLGSFDTFATAPEFASKTFTAVGSTTGFGVETGEPTHGSLNDEAGASAWVKWVAPARTRVQLDTLESNFDTILAVYQGDSLSNLQRITFNNDSDSRSETSALAFNAENGFTYYFVVAGVSGQQGQFNLNFSGSPLVAGVSFESRNVTVHQGNEAVISAAVSATGTATMRWQRMPAGSKTWTDLQNGESYSGVETSELRVISTQLGNNGDRFRLVVEDEVGISRSSFVTLTVTEFQAVVSEVLGTVSFDISQGNVPEPANGGAYFALGLPKGLVFDRETGVISGVISGRPGTYRVLYGSTDGKKRNPEQFILEIIVAPFSPSLTGAFEALLDNMAGTAPAGKLSLRVSSNGRYSGSYFVLADGRGYPFRGRVVLNQDTRSAGTSDDALQIISRGRARPPLALSFAITEPSVNADDAFATLTAVVSDEDDNLVAQSSNGVPLAQFTSADPAPWAGPYTARLFNPTLLGGDPTVDDVDVPLGSGYATAVVRALNGALQLRGRLPDHSILTANLRSSPLGSYRLAQRVRAPGGSLSGRITLSEGLDDDLATPRYSVGENSGSLLYWTKPPMPRDRLYPEGFGDSPLAMSLQMEPWTTPAGNFQTALGLSELGEMKINIEADILQDGNDPDRNRYNLPVDVRMAPRGSLSWVLPATNASRFALKLNAKSGAFSGSYFLTEPVASPNEKPSLVRKVTFGGVLLQTASTMEGDVIGDGFAVVPPGNEAETFTSALIRFLAGPTTPPVEFEPIPKDVVPAFAQ